MFLFLKKWGFYSENKLKGFFPSFLSFLFLVLLLGDDVSAIAKNLIQQKKKACENRFEEGQGRGKRSHVRL